MKRLHYILFITAITISSCKNNETAKAQDNPRVAVPFTQQTAAAMQNQAAQTQESPKHNLFHENNVATTPSILAGVNPAHGQPNHRCDIAVGAPLNTPANAGTSMSSAQVAPNTQISAAKTTTPIGMNPPHGEKNHRCDIAVGAPLNSKPSVSTATANTNSAQETKEYSVQQAVPALLSTAAAETETPAGINPAHGKTGHRCDIGVGKPLPK
jgi:hypothetical protein